MKRVRLLSKPFKSDGKSLGVSQPIIFFIVLLCSCMTTREFAAPEERAKEFLSNVYTGRQMKPEEWLSRDARTAPMFNAFGGLERMIQQSTARAERFGGFKSVDIREVTPSDQRMLVRAEVKFARDHKLGGDKGKAANEDIIWDLWFVREDGVWKIAP
jgi:hypothetical protein